MSPSQDDTAESVTMLAQASARRRSESADQDQSPKDLPGPAEVLTAWEGRVPQAPDLRVPLDPAAAPKVTAPPSARQLAEITELADKLDLPMVATAARSLRIDAAADLVDTLRSAAAEPPDDLTVSKSWATYAEQWSGEHPERLGRHGIADPGPKHAAGAYAATQVGLSGSESAAKAPAGLSHPALAADGPAQAGPAPTPGRNPNLDSARKQQHAPARAPRLGRR